MTVNNHITLRSVLELACHGLACSWFWTKLLRTLQNYAYTVNDKNVAQGLQAMSLMRLFDGVPRRVKKSSAGLTMVQVVHLNRGL